MCGTSPAASSIASVSCSKCLPFFFFFHHCLPEFNACIVILWPPYCLFFSSSSQGSNSVGECVSAIGPKDTFDGLGHGESLCEDDTSEGLAESRIGGRIAVHAGSEVVLKCEGNNNEGACDMLCWM